MSTNPNKPTGSDHHEKGTAESRPDDAALINRYSDFTRFSVQTAGRRLPGDGRGGHRARPGGHRRTGERGRSVEPGLTPGRG